MRMLFNATRFQICLYRCGYCNKLVVRRGPILIMDLDPNPYICMKCYNPINLEKKKTWYGMTKLYCKEDEDENNIENKV